MGNKYHGILLTEVDSIVSLINVRNYLTKQFRRLAFRDLIRRIIEGILKAHLYLRNVKSCLTFISVVILQVLTIIVRKPVPKVHSLNEKHHHHTLYVGSSEVLVR